MTDVREWLTVHCPDAQPWQVDLVEALITAHREGRWLTVTPARRYGITRVRAMAQECRTALTETEGTS